MEDLEIARRRLVFEEFLVLQLGLMEIKSGSRRCFSVGTPDTPIQRLILPGVFPG